MSLSNPTPGHVNRCLPCDLYFATVQELVAHVSEVDHSQMPLVVSEEGDDE